MRVRHVIAILVGCLIGGAIAAGVFDSTPSSPPAAASSQPPTAQQLAQLADQKRADLHDRAVSRALSAMRSAAQRGDRAAVARAQHELDRLAKTEPAPVAQPAEKDPFARAIDAFAFKRAPLYVQQVRTTDGSHRVSAGVDRDAFCLLTPSARLAAVRGVYAPLDRRLRAAGVRDLRFVVVVLTQREPTAKQELAIAGGGTVRLTARGRAC